MLQRWGVLRLISLKRSRSSSIPASWAMAVRWSTVFVEPPRAISTTIAFLNAASVRMSLGFTPSSRSPMTRLPDS